MSWTLAMGNGEDFICMCIPLGFILNQINLVHTLHPSYVSALMGFSFRDSYQNHVFSNLLTNVSCMSSWFHPSWLDYSSYIEQRVQVMMPLIMHFSPTSFLSFLCVKIFSTYCCQKSSNYVLAIMLVTKFYTHTKLHTKLHTHARTRAHSVTSLGGERQEECT
jgi:hypothetical protein